MIVVTFRHLKECGGVGEGWRGGREGVGEGASDYRLLCINEYFYVSSRDIFSVEDMQELKGGKGKRRRGEDERRERSIARRRRERRREYI